MEFAENASNRSFSSHQHSWGLRDHWRSGMHVPHPRLGWFPLSVKGGVIRHWSMTSPREYYQYLNDGYHSDYEFEQAIGRLPRRMHLCLVCKSIFDASYNNTVLHCDSFTHRNRLTEVLDLDGLLQSGIDGSSSPETELASQLQSMGIDNASNLYHAIPEVAVGEKISSFRPSHSSSSSTSSSTSSTPSVDLSSIFTNAMHISSASEVEYNDLLSAMRCMGLQ